ncbi:MAG: S9 family peptidase [Candidatus Acidiferrales bacterium]
MKSLITFAIALGLFSLPAASQVTPLRVEDIVAMHTFSDWTPVKFSPDGTRLAYAAKDNRKIGLNAIEQFPLTGVPFNGVGADIYVVQIKTGEVMDITGGIANNWAPTWSPDGRNLAFLSDRDGNGQAKLWILNMATGTMRKASEVSVRAIEMQWLPNSREVLLTSLPENLTPKQFADRALGNTVSKDTGQPEGKVPGSTVVLFRAEPSGRQGGSNTESAWNLDGWLRDVVLVDVYSGRTKVLDREHRITKVAVSPDGVHVAAAIVKRFEKPGSQQLLFDLKLLSLDDGKARILASDIRFLHGGASFNWSPDGSQLVYQTGGIEAVGDCYLVGLKGGAIKNLSNLHSRPNQRAYPPLWDPAGREVYFLHENSIWKASVDGETGALVTKIPGHQIFELAANQGAIFSADNTRSVLALTYDDALKQSGFYKVDLETGKSVKLRQEDQWYFTYSREDNVSISPDGKFVAFFLEDAQHAKELWLARQNLQNARRLTHINPQFDKYQMGSTRQIGWQSLDGEQLHGALLLPAGYQEGRRYPLLVCVYGGVSASSDVVRFGPACATMNMQLFATRGYAVLLPDAPQHLGTPMLDLAKTVLPGVNKVIEMGIADSSRLGVMGHSYGGYSVLSLIVQTKRFKAAMAADGYGDILAAYGQMDKSGATYNVPIAENGQALMGGTPWQVRDRYIENSPLFYLDRVETPLLLVHGAEDNAVAPFLAEEVFVGLRRLGKEVVYAKYQDESHSPQTWSYANQLDFCNRVIAWFDAHLKT